MSSMIIKENIPLAPFTTMRVGGQARYFAEVRNTKEVLGAIDFARAKSLGIFILGGGSNIIVSDDGFPGMVIYNRINGFVSERSGDKVLVRVGSGEDWDWFLKRAAEEGWAGLENLSGVPGTVGATPVQNVGAYGRSVEEVITFVKCVEIESGKVKVFGRNDCEFGYRDSIFRSSARGKYFITEVEFELIPGGETCIGAYPDIEKYFAGVKSAPTVLEMREAILNIRESKGMLAMRDREGYMSVGSFFKNPVISAEHFAVMRGLVEHLSPPSVSKWFWEQKDGSVKIAAARLVELSGFLKGHREGRVGISPKHSLAIINLGGATARDVMALAKKIELTVRDKFEITLDTEAEWVGPATS